MKPLLLVLSLLANAALVAAFVLKPALVPPAVRDYFARTLAASPEPARPSVNPIPAASAAAPGSGLWSTLATTDLAALVARLRAAGFPSSAIRVLVQAEIEARYGARMRALSQGDPDAPFWKSTVGLGMDATRLAEYLQLSSERSKLLRELLGNFAARDDGTLAATQRRQYGSLPQSKIDQLERINQDYAELTNQVRTATNGITLPEDREKLALLEREKRADLVALLSPEELADYDMRNSPITNRLRPALALFNATEDEFRAIYKVQQAYSGRLDLTESIIALPPTERTAFLQQRTNVQKELDAQMQALLGDQRYAEFARASDSDYQRLTRLAEKENLPAQAAIQAYDLRNQVSQESNRIFNDTSFNYDQKLASLQSLAQDTRAQLVATLGQTAGEAYVKTANWLTSVERGAAVTFTPTGGTSIRGLPNPNAPTRQIITSDGASVGTITLGGGTVSAGTLIFREAAPAISSPPPASPPTPALAPTR